MMMWPISTRANKPDNDDPTILEPLEPVGGSSSDVPGGHRPSYAQETVEPKENAMSSNDPENHGFARLVWSRIFCSEIYGI